MSYLAGQSRPGHGPQVAPSRRCAVDQFDPNYPGLMQGDITNVAVIDPSSPPGQLGNLVLDPDKDFTLEITWRVSGVLAALWLAPLAQDWDITVFAESIGAGPEKRIGSATKDKTQSTSCGADCLEYTATVTVPAGTLPEDNGTNVSGVYKLVVTVFLDSTIGPYDLAGFREGPAIRMENPN
jgi:hypothetical protein